jgi:hypothetical protein
MDLPRLSSKFGFTPFANAYDRFLSQWPLSARCVGDKICQRIDWPLESFELISKPTCTKESVNLFRAAVLTTVFTERVGKKEKSQCRAHAPWLSLMVLTEQKDI